MLAKLATLAFNAIKGKTQKKQPQNALNYRNFRNFAKQKPYLLPREFDVAARVYDFFCVISQKI